MVWHFVILFLLFNVAFAAWWVADRAQRDVWFRTSQLVLFAVLWAMIYVASELFIDSKGAWVVATLLSLALRSKGPVGARRLG